MLLCPVPGMVLGQNGLTAGASGRGEAAGNSAGVFASVSGLKQNKRRVYLGAEYTPEPDPAEFFDFSFV